MITIEDKTVNLKRGFPDKGNEHSDAIQKSSHSDDEVKKPKFEAESLGETSSAVAAALPDQTDLKLEPHQMESKAESSPQKRSLLEDDEKYNEDYFIYSVDRKKLRFHIEEFDRTSPSLSSISSCSDESPDSLSLELIPEDIRPIEYLQLPPVKGDDSTFEKLSVWSDLILPTDFKIRKGHLGPLWAPVKPDPEVIKLQRTPCTCPVEHEHEEKDTNHDEGVSKNESTGKEEAQGKEENKEKESEIIEEQASEVMEEDKSQDEDQGTCEVEVHSADEGEHEDKNLAEVVNENEESDESDNEDAILNEFEDENEEQNDQILPANRDENMDADEGCSLEDE